MALEAEVVVPFRQHFRVNRAMHIVASNAAFPQRFMLKDVGAGLLAMALGTLGVDASHERSLGRINVSAMRVVAGSAAHPPLENRMVELQVKLRLLFKVTLETGLRLLLRIHDELAATAAGIHVQAGRAMAGFAAAGKSDAVPFTGDLQSGMLGEFEILDDGFMAGRALIHPHKLGARNDGRRRHHALDGGAGDHQRRPSHDRNS